MDGRLHTDLFADEYGFTTTSTVLALLISLSLIFVTAQVYRINSLSAQVQDVADAAALAAESQVAEFMVVARVCDAIVLSLSLTGITVVGLGAAALCTPATAGASKTLIDIARKVFQARDSFSEHAADALNTLQELLPFFAAARAASVAAANSSTGSGSAYVGIALLVPLEADELQVEGSGEYEEPLTDLEEQADTVREKAEIAEQCAQEAQASKQRAYERDCGDNPAYCMFERADTLAGLPASCNPLYSSVDTWSFSVALERARAYYETRLEIEQPLDSSLDEQARSNLRRVFYQYAIEQLSDAYVHETEDSFDAYFPHFPRNTEQMRSTALYTAALFPVSEGEDGLVMHAWEGCPEAADSIGYGSISQMEHEGYSECPTCRFRASSLGKVAAASTSVANGFEYHYEAVATEADQYEAQRAQLDPMSNDVKDTLKPIFDALSDLVGKLGGVRIQPSPSGKDGAIALVVNVGSTSASGGFENAFVDVSGTLGPRAAVSAATLLDEESEEGRTVLNSLLDGVRQEGGAAVGVPGLVLDCWSAMLSVYCEGQESFVSGVRDGLNALPLASASGLGDWAGDALVDLAETSGLQPAELTALKPVLVNSAHVANAAEGDAAAVYFEVKRQVIAHPLMSTDLFSSLLSDAERQALSKVNSLGSSIEIASIQLLGDYGPSIPVRIPLPEAVTSTAQSFVIGAFDELRMLYAQVSGVRVWE